MSETLAALHAKRGALMPWLWTSTVLAMLTSLGEGTTLMMSLGSPLYIAVLFPLASDVGLIAALRGTAALSEAGHDVRAARPLRWFALVFCLALNIGSSVLGGHWVAALFHAGIPALVMALATFEETYAAAFSALIRNQREADRLAAEAQAREAAKRAELVEHAEPEPAAEPAAPKAQASKPRVPRRTDPEVLAEIRALIAASTKRVTQREVQAACRVSPGRAGRLLRAIAAEAEAEPPVDGPSAYL